MRVAEVFQEKNLPVYVRGLLSTESRKTCTNIAQATSQSHDTIYHPFKSAVEKAEILRKRLFELAQKTFSGNTTYLIFDDSQLSKPHAKEIEGLDISFDGSIGRTELGFQMITALLTNGNARMPVDTIPYVTKQIAGACFKTKSELAIQLASVLLKIFKIDIFLADAHYSTKTFMSFLKGLGQNFLMKFTCTRIVTIGEKTGQLRDVLKLSRNEHVRCAKGIFNGMPCYFYVAKIKTGTVVYFISLEPIAHKELIALYKIRWNIELYHRTAKQSLGWKECQMKSLKKQVLHSFYVMYAYALADLVRIKKNFETTEDAIKYLSIAKNMRHVSSLFRTGENLYYAA